MRYRINLFSITVVSFVVALIGVLIFMIYLIVNDENECESRGGEMVGTGEYYTTMISTGKTIVPITNEKMECSK